jgi:predicted O-methyltransferase YrrM
MTENSWAQVENYFTDLLNAPDPALDAALEASAEAGLPAINVAPSQGKLLYLLARMVGARRILEIGTLGGYSTIWLGRSLPADGRLISLEAEPRHAEIARANLARAGLANVVDVRVGRALDTLPQLVDEGQGPFDLFFIDADKPNNATYFDWALRLSRPGSVIIVDNVVRGGRVVDASADDEQVDGVRRLLERMAQEPRVDAAAVQTVGSKGYDGFAIALVTEA